MKSDSKDIVNWRNDLVTRQMSLTPNKISFNDHSNWYEASLKNPKRCLLLCIDSEIREKIGVVRFDRTGIDALISINLAPISRGKGLAAKCLIQSIAYYTTQEPQVKTISAKIKRENIKSSKSFERAGFSFDREIGGVRYFTLEIR